MNSPVSKHTIQLYDGRVVALASSVQEAHPAVWMAMAGNGVWRSDD